MQHNGFRTKVTSEDKKRYFARGMSGNVATGGKSGVPDFIRNKTKFPKFKPYFRYLLVDHEGYILIPTYEMENENYIYDVFTPDGEFVNKLISSSFEPLSTNTASILIFPSVSD